jgi:hypothetical protein
VLPSQRDRTRRYRTRQDPFAEVWRAELVPMLAAMPSLRATTLLEELQRRHPARYPDRILRSLQRRVAHWRATEGPERELIFRQEHPPGLQALSDFTDSCRLGVTLGGEPFPHLLYHFWLAFSGWQYVKAICGGESFTAQTEGVQEALWQLGGVPRTASHRPAFGGVPPRRGFRSTDAAPTAQPGAASLPASSAVGGTSKAKPSTKSLFANTEAQCARRSAAPSNFHKCKS